MIVKALIAGLISIGSSAAVCAFELELPSNAVETVRRDRVLARYELPIGPYEDGNVPTQDMEGQLLSRAFRVGVAGLTPLQLVAPLREQLSQAGYEIVLDCDQTACGGFDFRFALDILPAPNMYVSLRNYHFLSARARQGEGAVTVIASSVDTNSYLQITVLGSTSQAPEILTSTASLRPAITALDGFAAKLLQTGSAVLDDVIFETGSTELNADASFETLGQLSELILMQPDLRFAIVGHTDATGPLNANIRISRARAQAVRARLIAEYDVPAGRLEAEGMGYLAPIASNLTEEGRAINRRVEAIIIGVRPD